jgi:SAM-dependent methyltransferase
MSHLRSPSIEYPPLVVGRSIHDDEFYAPTRPANLFLYQQRARAMLRLLTASGDLPLHGKRILDVGCGAGRQLIEFETWGAQRAELAGIDVDESRVRAARDRLTCASASGATGADLRCGDAAALPWSDGTFDIVHQSVVFTSLGSVEFKRAVAMEMLRVLKPGGAVLWYDFLYDNPSNPTVKGVGAAEIRALFPNCEMTLKRVTLAPPIARRLVPVTWLLATLLETLVLANTHYLGIIRKPLGRADGAA